jgi:hypothetical protein
MHTTNMSSAESPMTYQTLHGDCERLATIAKKMAILTSENPSFRDDPKFDELTVEFRGALMDVQSVAITF